VTGQQFGRLLLENLLIFVQYDCTPLIMSGGELFRRKSSYLLTRGTVDFLNDATILNPDVVMVVGDSVT